MSSVNILPPPTEVFSFYADADESLQIELEKHLSPLCHEGFITTWHKRKVTAGTDRSKIIHEHLNTAAIILLLISVDFISSDYCSSIEMQRAMERHEAGDACVIPLLLRPVNNWQGTRFGKLQALPSNEIPVVSWHNQDDAFVDIAKGIRSVLQAVQPVAVSTSSAALPRLWNIPYPRNPFFTGRDDVLACLDAQLHAGKATALSQPQVISGLGGIGKTQIAIEYAYRHYQNYQAVLWARAESTEALVSSYVALAGLLELPEKDAPDQSITVQAVKVWLQRQHQWLLILDNADDLAVVREFLPAAMDGHLLLTTRAQSMGRLASRIEVETFSLEQGAQFLLQRAGLLAPDAALSQASIEDRMLATQITQDLGGLPLALDQAGAYLEETRCHLVDYQSLYRIQRMEVLNRRGGIVNDHPEAVTTTWSVSFQKVENEMPAAADLLRFCAYLSADAIPEEIITKGAVFLGSIPDSGERKKRRGWFSLAWPLLQKKESSSSLDVPPFDLNKAVAVLGAYSLLQRDRREKTLSVHRLVQSVIRDALPTGDGKRWMQRAVLAINISFPDVEFVQWAACERWLPHALVCATWIEQEHMVLLEAADLLNQIAYYLHDRGRYSEAQPLYERALEIYQRRLGSEHPDTATSLNNLAGLYESQGRYAEALPLYERALEISERKLGSEHADTAKSLNNLAGLYYRQGKYAEAFPLYERALEIKERQLGETHPSTATSLNNLAGLYKSQGKYAEALPLYERALEIYRRQLGETHPSTAMSLNDLAGLYESQGRYVEALPLYERALEIREQKLGPVHPNTTTSLNSLALLYKNQRKYVQAQLLYERALEIYELRLGIDHPQTRIIRENYTALVCQLKGDGTWS